MGFELVSLPTHTVFGLGKAGGHSVKKAFRFYRFFFSYKQWPVGNVVPEPFKDLLIVYRFLFLPGCLDLLVQFRIPARGILIPYRIGNWGIRKLKFGDVFENYSKISSGCFQGIRI